MNIVVLIKQTPDTAELPKVTADEVRSGAVKATMVINPWDEFAAEEAILLTDRFDGDVTAVSMGPADAVDALKHALAMGVGNASLIDNSGVAGDMWTTAAALASFAADDFTAIVARAVLAAEQRGKALGDALGADGGETNS